MGKIREAMELQPLGELLDTIKCLRAVYKVKDLKKIFLLIRKNEYVK